MIETIPGMLSLEECRAAIEHHGKLINSDIHYIEVNTVRINSMRALVDLFEQYNNLLTDMGDSGGIG